MSSCRHLLGKDLYVVAAEFLGAVHGHVGVGEQFTRRSSLVGEASHSHAAADLQGAALQLQRHGDCRADVLKPRQHDIPLLRQPVQENDELVAADAHDKIGFPHGGPHAPCDGFQELITCRVAKAVVDQFEIVEVEKGEHGALVPLADLLEHAVDLLFKKDAVRQARQGVMVGQETDTVLRPLALDGDSGEVSGHGNQFLLLLARGCDLMCVERECAEHLALARQDGRGPAGTETGRFQEKSVVRPERVGVDIGDDDLFAAPGGRSARARIRAYFQRMNSSAIRPVEAGSSAVQEMPAVFGQKQDRAFDTGKKCLDQQHQLVEEFGQRLALGYHFQ